MVINTLSNFLKVRICLPSLWELMPDQIGGFVLIIYFCIFLRQKKKKKKDLKTHFQWTLKMGWCGCFISFKLYYSSKNIFSLKQIRYFKYEIFYFQIEWPSLLPFGVCFSVLLFLFYFDCNNLSPWFAESLCLWLYLGLQEVHYISTDILPWCYIGLRRIHSF